MSEAASAEFLNRVVDLGAGVVVSGHDCPHYNDALRDWGCHEFELPNHSGQGRSNARRVKLFGWVASQNAPLRGLL
jgi:hypothetical protein